jgi:hypothetical protein
MSQIYEFDFKILNISIHDSIHNYPIEKQREIFNYLNEMDEHDRKAYEIAFNHLGSSFNIYRSNGFKEWQQKNKFSKS